MSEIYCHCDYGIPNGIPQCPCDAEMMRLRAESAALRESLAACERNVGTQELLKMKAEAALALCEKVVEAAKEIRTRDLIPQEHFREGHSGAEVRLEDCPFMKLVAALAAHAEAGKEK